MLQSSWGFACTSLEGVSRWAFHITENLFTDSEIIWKNHPQIPLKSVACLGGKCPGGVLLTECESSPLQVIWRLRVGAALWSFKSVIWEPERPENHKIHDFHNFGTLGMSEQSRLRKKSGIQNASIELRFGMCLRWRCVLDGIQSFPKTNLRI